MWVKKQNNSQMPNYSTPLTLNLEHVYLYSIQITKVLVTLLYQNYSIT